MVNKEYEELVNKRTKNGERVIAFVKEKDNEENSYFIYKFKK